MDYQDVLAVVGAGTAHPGGMTSTVKWTKALGFKPTSRVLEVGCGTGRTLCHIAARYGCDCTGVDIRGSMIEKARLRSQRNNLQLHWIAADAAKLPFGNDSFDVVFTESVNVFVPDMHKALLEYYRVLKPYGTYLDVEMTLMAPVDEAWKSEVKRIYGAQSVPDMKGWKTALSDAGFNMVKIMHSQGLDPAEMMSSDSKHPDMMDLSSPGAYQNPNVIDTLSANSNWMENNYRRMGFIVVSASKEGA